MSEVNSEFAQPSPRTWRGDYRIPENTHSFALRGAHSRTDVPPIEVMATLRKARDNLPVTKNTVRLRSLHSYFTNNGDVTDTMMHALGMWRIPPWFGNQSRWVNPHGVHAHTYAAVVAHCSCGAVCVDPTGKHPYTGGDDHSATCEDTDWLTDLDVHRREWIIRGCRLGLTSHVIGARMGVDDDTVRTLIHRYDIDADRYRGEWMHVRARTMAELYERDIDIDVIADGYGISSSTVRNHIADPNSVGIEPTYNPFDGGRS